MSWLRHLLVVHPPIQSTDFCSACIVVAACRHALPSAAIAHSVGWKKCRAETTAHVPGADWRHVGRTACMQGTPLARRTGTRQRYDSSANRQLLSLDCCRSESRRERTGGSTSCRTATSAAWVLQLDMQFSSTSAPIGNVHLLRPHQRWRALKELERLEFGICRWSISLYIICAVRHRAGQGAR